MGGRANIFSGGVMDGTQFLVQWEEHPSHLSSRLGYLLERQSLVDVTLMCNTHTLKVHRAVLAACSPYFERQLGNHPLIVLKDMKFSVLKSLVEFMYCGETSVSEENLSSLLEAAKFFEVRGLSSMTKESLCAPNAPLNSKALNGTTTPTTSGCSRVGLSSSGRGRGRGRGRPPTNSAPLTTSTTKMGSPTEPAQILLSLSGGAMPAAPSATVNQLSHDISTFVPDVKTDPRSTTAVGAITHEPKVSPKSTGFDPIRRNRRRGGGLPNTTFRDRLIRGQDPLVNENFRRDLNDDGEVSSPLLSSLLTKPPISGVNKNSSSPSSTANKYLREMNEQGHVPILVDNGEGKLITLSNDLLNTSFINDPPPPPTLPSPSSLNGSTSSYVVEELQMNRPSVAEPTTLSLAEVTGPKTTTSDEVLDEEMIQSLRNGAASEAENEPEAVVLFEVTENKKVEKYVVSAKEVSLLKALNETLTQQKKELADITKNNNINTIDVAGSNAKVAELILKINKTKSILSQVVGYAQTVKDKLKGALSTKAQTNKDDKNSNKSQTVQLEFIDGNGEKIEGYQVTGTLVDKKESRDELMGLFDLVSEPTNQNPLLGGGQPVIDKDKLEVESSYQLEDNSENMSFHIDDMMNDTSSNIVIEDKSQDFKYIMDNDGNIMNQDEHYVVYENENVIYDGGLGGDDSSQAIHDDEAEYVVYSDDPVSKGVVPTDGHDYLCYNNSKVDEESDFAVYPPEDSGVLSSSDKLDALQANIVDDPVYHHDNPTVDGYSDDLDPISTPQVLSCPSSPSASTKMVSPATKRLAADLETTPSPSKKSRLSHDL